MKKIIIPIIGMHCRSCEMLIENKLSEIPEVNQVKLDYKKGVAEVYYDDQRPNDHEMEEAIRSSGYSIGSDQEKELISKNPSDYQDLGIALFFLAGIYIILKNFGLTNVSFGSDLGSPSSFSVVLLIGLTAGFSTCMALVGGLVLGLSARHAEKHPEATTAQKFRPHIFFNLGRVLGYIILGALLGSIGSIFQISNTLLGLFTIIVGAIMFMMGLQLIEIFPVANRIKFTLPKFVSRILGIKNHEKEYNHRSSAIMGAMTFFLPCGFTQAMQLYAISTGSALTGGLVMGTFALGTVPGLLGIGGLTSAVKGILAKRFFKAAGILVIFFALFNISNGYNLTGWQLGSVSSEVGDSQSSDPNVTLQDGVQVVNMRQISNGYSPNKFTIRKGVPVKWIITSEDPYSCASSIVMSKYNISKRLSKGENIIEFTPTETGALKFSCSMGMYTGVFNVVDAQGNGGASATDVDKFTKSSGGSCGGSIGGCGGCGGGGKTIQSTEETVKQEESISTNTANGSSSANSTQVINTVYTEDQDIQPNNFTVKAGIPVKFVIDVKEDGFGCMSTIMIPGLYNTPEYLEKGKVEMVFTPTKSGDYRITCAMGVPRGTLKVK